MSSLTKALTKYIVKILCYVAGFVLFSLLGLFILRSFNINSYYVMIPIGLVMLIIFYFLLGFLDKVMDKWKLPKLKKSERMRYLVIDTLLTLVLFTVITFLFHHWLAYIIIPILFIYKEYHKWKDYDKEFKTTMFKTLFTIEDE